jgi:hypothetical protein
MAKGNGKKVNPKIIIKPVNGSGCGALHESGKLSG